jgi:putative oxidoreductase
MTKSDSALLLIRLAFGLSMAFHGLNKVKGGSAGTAAWFGSIGLKWPRFQAALAAGTEMGAGIMLTVGLLTPFACVAFVSLMLVAIVTVHWRVGYFIFLPNGGWEYCFSIAVVATAVGLLGPGKYSVDHSLGISLSWGAWVTPIAVMCSMCHLLLSYRPVRAETKP